MSSPTVRFSFLVAIIGLALWLRIADLAQRPMHSDEANQAVKLGQLIETGHYVFDPHDHHGPTLYYAALPIAWLRGEKSLAALTETTARLVPALAGTLAVLLLFFFAAPAGPWPALAAAALLAVSPPAVYYSRYFIQETLLATFTLGALICAQKWWLRGNLSWAIAAGVCAGLMQATKAIAPLFAGAAIVALLCAKYPRAAYCRPARDLAFAAGAAIITAALFYSSFGSNWSGLSDALAVYGPALQRASDGAGHEKPWWYYLQLFGWERIGGLVWQQLLFSLLALGGGVLALLQRRAFSIWVAVFSMIVGAALSLTPYKTPWHVVHLVPGFCILAATALAAFPRWWIGAVVAMIVLASQFAQTRLAVFTRPADPRNPYAYVHSVPDVFKFRPLVERTLAGSPNGIIRVIGEEYWPLPWYLRGLPRVGYWSEPTGDCDGALIIASSSQASAVRARLHGSYRETYLGLRPDVLCVVFTPTP